MATLEGGSRPVVPNAEGGRTTPSVVAFTKDGSARRRSGAATAGHEPREHRVLDQALHGRKYSEVNEEMTIVPYKVEEGPNGTWRVRRVQEYAPEEISAMILQKLKSDAEAYLGEPVNDAVITSPVLQQRQRERRRLPAPSPASTSSASSTSRPRRRSRTARQGRRRPDDPRLRLGGGTFDVSVLESR